MTRKRKGGRQPCNCKEIKKDVSFLKENNKRRKKYGRENEYQAIMTMKDI